MVQRGAVWCSVVQFLAVCVVQCGAVWFSVVQRGAACCNNAGVHGVGFNGLQRPLEGALPPSRLARCSVLQRVAVWCSVLQAKLRLDGDSRRLDGGKVPFTYCNTLQHTATHCNTLQHTTTHCNALQHTATRCNTLQRTATHCNALRRTATRCNSLQHTVSMEARHLERQGALPPLSPCVAVCCSVMQCVAVCCSVL